MISGRICVVLALTLTLIAAGIKLCFSFIILARKAFKIIRKAILQTFRKFFVSNFTSNKQIIECMYNKFKMISEVSLHLLFGIRFITKPVYAICEQQMRRSACKATEQFLIIRCLDCMNAVETFLSPISKTRVSFHSWTGLFAPLSQNSENRFSHDVARCSNRRSRRPSWRCMGSVGSLVILLSDLWWRVSDKTEDLWIPCPCHARRLLYGSWYWHTDL